MIKLSVKKPFAVLVAVIIILMLAAVSLTRMTTDLLPDISTPYLMVITTDPGASPERVEQEVTEVLESSLSTVNGVSSVTSTSAENYSMIMLEFEDDTNMDSALVKVNNAVDEVKDSLPELAGTPSIMEISMDMMATMYVAVVRDDMDIYQLTDYVNNTLEPYFLRQDGVASVTTLGLVEEMVEVRLNEDKIAALNDQLASQVEDSLDEVRLQLDDAQAEIDSGRSQLEDGQAELEESQNAAADEFGELTLQLNQALATQAAYEAILTSQQANQTALQAERSAYENAGLLDQYAQINDTFAQMPDLLEQAYTLAYDTAYTQILVVSAQAVADGLHLEVTVTEDNLEDYLNYLPDSLLDTAAEQARAIAEEATMGIGAEDLPTDVADALSHPEKLEHVRTLLAGMGEQDAADLLTTGNLQQLYDIVEVRIPQIDSGLGNLTVEIAASQAVLDQINGVVAQVLDNYAAVEAGKMSATAALAAVSAQLSSAESALEEAQTQMDAAAEEYDAARDAALESANLDSLLNLSTLSTLIYAQNFAMPAGYIDDAEDHQWLLKVGEEFTSQEELASLVLTQVEGIGDIALEDVADITLLDNSSDSFMRMDGQDAVVLCIFKGSTAGTSAVSKTCNAAIQNLEQENVHLHITPLMDQGDYIKLFLSSITSNIIFGALLAVIVLAIFLRSAMPTLVVAFSIPFSFLVAVLVMYFTGITMNMMSMSGLALGIGMLVDNSIVVIENIYRMRMRGMPAPRAAVQGAKQVSGAIIASTLTTVCVFLPMIFTTGMVRQLMIPFALTISYALIASLLVALSVVPCLGSVLLRRSQPKQSKLFQKVLSGYGKALDFCLRRKYVPLGLAVVLLAFSIGMVVRMGIVVIPSMNSDQMYLVVHMDEDMEMEECYEKADGIMYTLLDVDGVDQVGVMTNTSQLLGAAFSVGENNYRTFDYYLVLDDRVDTVDELNAVSDRIEDALAGEERCEIDLSQSSAMDLSALTSSGLTINIYGQNSETLKTIARDVADMVESVTGFTDVSDGQEEADQVIQLNIDRAAAARLGLTTAQIYSELSARLTTTATATSITMDDLEISVEVVDERNLLTYENLMDLEFETTSYDADGTAVTETHTLGEFAEVELTDGYVSIDRENGTHVTQVTATTEDGYNTTKLSSQVRSQLDQYDLPSGYTVEIAGEVEQVNDMVRQMLELLALGVVLVYLVMVAQFQSLLSPLIILFTVPLAFTGGMLGLLISGDQLSMVSLLGFTVLMGTVVNNGIVFVDYTNQLRMGGLGKRDALIATGKTRMRPILMTALTTIFAMGTMMFSRDITASLSRGMAVVVAGGLAYATLMTLFVVPVLYDIFYRRQPKKVDVGEDLDDVPDDVGEYLKALQNGTSQPETR